MKISRSTFHFVTIPLLHDAKQDKKTVSFWWENNASILTRKYSREKSAKTYFSQQESLFLSNINCIWSTFLLNTSEQKNGKERSGFGWVFVFFQWENQPHTNTKICNQMYLQGPQKLWNLRKQKKNMLPTCDKWMKKKAKGNVWEECLLQKSGVALTHHPGNFFELWQALGAFFVVCMPEFICHNCLHEPLLPAHKLRLFLIKNRHSIEWGSLFWVGPPF